MSSLRHFPSSFGTRIVAVTYLTMTSDAHQVSIVEDLLLKHAMPRHYLSDMAGIRKSLWKRYRKAQDRSVTAGKAPLRLDGSPAGVSHGGWGRPTSK
jgi:hypothetical protein